MNYSELYAAIQLRRERIFDACRKLRPSQLKRVDYEGQRINLLAFNADSSLPLIIPKVPSLLTLCNDLFHGEDYWLRQTLEKEPSVFPEGGFLSQISLENALREHAGVLLTLTGLGPEGGWDAYFTLPDNPDLQYPASVIFQQFVLQEQRKWGEINILLLMNGIEVLGLDLI